MTNHIESGPLFLTAAQVAEVMNCTTDTLAQQRHRGMGIPFVKLGGLIRYRREAVIQFIEEQERKSLRT
ncbi:MAG: helix-turn-helix domain-containing protein [Maricaulis sp.]|uniref:helix-turn-helix domain-containing protein n=1 Tax=Maricaulis sp. TaxID=1486257 RepID=UPI00260DA7A8|nr:helix-turn-helix domain-containing protein [Maricaulis sp.]MDM7983269.1 helix-turn-helix domain-containing protein [Maricaulis sp.]